MATLTVRNLPDHVHDALRRRAAENRRSMEAEAREVLASVCGARPTADDAKRILHAFWQTQPPKRPGEPENWSGTDEFLADKHLEGAWENGFVTDDERRDWMDRLARFEVWPEAVEAFVASRLPQE